VLPSCDRHSGSRAAHPPRPRKACYYTVSPTSNHDRATTSATRTPSPPLDDAPRWSDVSDRRLQRVPNLARPPRTRRNRVTKAGRRPATHPVAPLIWIRGVRPCSRLQRDGTDGARVGTRVDPDDRAVADAFVRRGARISRKRSPASVGRCWITPAPRRCGRWRTCCPPVSRVPAQERLRSGAMNTNPAMSILGGSDCHNDTRPGNPNEGNEDDTRTRRPDH
jgi:hypothetical protein